jgi:hypothetical protein
MKTVHTCPNGHRYVTAVVTVMRHPDPQPVDPCPVCEGAGH